MRPTGHDEKTNHFVEDPMQDQNVTYTAPALSELGTVTQSTLGSNKNDRADDTEYWD